MTLHVLCWWCTNELHTHEHGNETHYVNVEGKLKERKNWTKGIKSNKLDNLVKLKCNFMKWGVSFFIINGFDVVLFMFVLVFWWLIYFCVCVKGDVFSCIFLSKNFHSTTSITRVKILFSLLTFWSTLSILSIIDIPNTFNFHNSYSIHNFLINTTLALDFSKYLTNVYNVPILYIRYCTTDF